MRLSSPSAAGAYERWSIRVPAVSSRRLFDPFNVSTRRDRGRGGFFTYPPVFRRSVGRGMQNGLRERNASRTFFPLSPLFSLSYLLCVVRVNFIAAQTLRLLPIPFYSIFLLRVTYFFYLYIYYIRVFSSLSLSRFQHDRSSRRCSDWKYKAIFPRLPRHGASPFVYFLSESLHVPNVLSRLRLKFHLGLALPSSVIHGGERRSAGSHAETRGDARVRAN